MAFTLDLNSSTAGVHTTSAVNEQTVTTLLPSAVVSSGGGTQSVDRITIVLGGGVRSGEVLTVCATAAGGTISGGGTKSITCTGTNIRT